MTKRVAQPGLFDDELPPAPPREWSEVPQVLFLSWSVARQLAYCAARDLDSATSAEQRGEHAEWYVERAASYQSRATS